MQHENNYIGEQEIIKELLNIYSKSQSTDDIYDDAAVVSLNDNVLVISTDTVAESTHKAPFATWTDFGYYAMVVNFSDIYAKGVKPAYIVKAISMPINYDLELIREVALGINEACKAHKVKILGGDTKLGCELRITPTVFGITTINRVLRRRISAKTGYVYTTRGCGRSAAALDILLAVERGVFDPNVNTIRAMVETVMRPPIPKTIYFKALEYMVDGVDIGTMDNSDGLVRSLYILSELNNIEITINRDAITNMTYALRSHFDFIKTAINDPQKYVLYGGGDFTPIIICDREVEIEGDIDGLLNIGYFTPGKGVYIQQHDNKTMLPNIGYDHFAKNHSH